MNKPDSPELFTKAEGLFKRAKDASGNALRTARDAGKRVWERATEAVGARRQPQRQDGIAEERQRQDQADGQRVQAGSREVQHEDDRQEAVGEQAERAKGEEDAAVAIEAAQAGQESVVDRARVGRHAGECRPAGRVRPRPRVARRTMRRCPPEGPTR